MTRTMLRTLIIVLIGAAAGGLMGHFGRCIGGTCPLTSTWWRGALYGAAIATMFALSGPRA